MNVAPPVPKLETAAIGFPITRLGISFFPIYLPDNSLPEITTGASSGLVIEELEHAEVPTLSAYNPNKTPALIVEGEHLVGGKQNRSVNATILVPAETKLEIPVTCLEQGRWGRERQYARAASFTPARIRTLNQYAVHSNRRANRSYHGDQTGVWSTVDNVLHMGGTRSRTSAVADADAVYKRDTPRRDAVRSLSARGPLPGQCGFAVTHGRWVVATELFGSHRLLQGHWTSLIRSYLLEAASTAGPPSPTAVLGQLRKLAMLTSHESPAIGLGAERRVKSQGIVAQALALSESLVHCSAFWLKGEPKTTSVAIART